MKWDLIMEYSKSQQISNFLIKTPVIIQSRLKMN